ncbi:putative transcriptional regulator [Gordonia polyisoprenivorans VH2]|uniref:Putative transcriptional regulator n=1 Tax=Gordonia polyisoprenivorans (strain DSM 44266 / VH2) TaxID=1112204 RepID=H6MVT7_GORPV|nr:helix-turn-helix domain-containing protein [Gordonia polyisoprenivorans]AFA75387.1 putative transcriptional regulator [Gordonia polyisoprenivorans VH2]
MLAHPIEPEPGIGCHHSRPRYTGLTVADLSARIGAPIVTPDSDATAPLEHVVDVGSTAKPRAEDAPVFVGEAHAATTVVLLRWASLRPDGPLPDLLPLFTSWFRSYRPAAIVVSPARPVNPPPLVIDHVRRLDSVLLWDRSGDPHLAQRLRDALRPSDADTTEPDPEGLSARLLSVADNLPAICDALGEAIGARVELRRKGFRSRRTTAGSPIVMPLGTHADLIVDSDHALGDAQRALVESARPLLTLHARISDATDDERGVESSRALRDILGDDLALREQSIRRSVRLNLFGNQAMVAIAVEPFNVSVDLPGLGRLRSEIAPVAARFDPSSSTAVKDGLAVVLISDRVDLSVFLRELCRTITVPIAVGVGDAVSSPRGIPGSFRQARRAVAVGRRTEAINRLTLHSELGVLALLYQLPEHARREFVATTLGPIADTSADAQEQRRVLRVLRATDCNVSESARRLYVHPNTLRARVSRIEEVVGPILTDPENRLTVFTALTMYSLDSNSDE